MAAAYGMVLACKLDLLTGVHQPGDTYMVALYHTNATLNQFTETYTKEGEVKGQGYTAGGKALTGYKAGIMGSRAVVSWDESVVWKNATISARHALIYNKSKGNRALTILDLGQVVSSTNGNWELALPPATETTAVLWIG